MTTAWLTVSPERLVPHPRLRSGAPVPVTDAVRRDDVVERPWDHDADRHLAEVRGVGGVERPGGRVEAHLACDGRPQLGARARPCRGARLRVAPAARPVARAEAAGTALGPCDRSLPRTLMPETAFLSQRRRRPGSGAPPARAASARGRRAPGRAGARRRRASRTPSNSIRSSRSWVWKSSRCRTRPSAAEGVGRDRGRAVARELELPALGRDRSRAARPVKPPQRVTSACRQSTQRCASSSRKSRSR